MCLKIIVTLAVVINMCLAATTGLKGIVRPCKLTDKRCIGENLKVNSICNPVVRGSVPKKYTIYNVPFETPFFNASYIDKELVVRNHNACVVSEFFFNMEGDSAVLSIDCPQLDLESNRTLIQHYSKKEDKEYHYHIRGVYPLVRLTTNLRHADKLDLCSAFVFADVTALPVFKINPLDKPTNKFLSRDLSFLNIYERETFFYRAKLLLRYFVNSYICNFGCNF